MHDDINAVIRCFIYIGGTSNIIEKLSTFLAIGN